MTALDAYAEFRRAQQFLDADRPADAAAILAPVVAAEPANTAALELYARALFASAQLERAQGALTALVERTPDDGWARLALARTLERLGRPAEAAPQRRMAAVLGQPA